MCAGSLAATHAHVWLDLFQLFLGSSGAAAQLLRLAAPLAAALQPPDQALGARQVCSCALRAKDLELVDLCACLEGTASYNS